jgi:hypothetical protein
MKQKLADYLNNETEQLKARQKQNKFTELTFDSEHSLVKKYVDGCCVAIRFCKGMRSEQMLAALQMDYPQAHEWRDYDEGTNIFLS